MAKIAFLGMGAMGSRMAANLLKAGHTVNIWNRDRTKAEALVAHGARVADTPRAAASGAEYIFSMVTDDEAARHVWLDAKTGALIGMEAGAIAIECSTVTPAWVLELEQAVLATGGQLVDAPVAGSRPQAEAGQLLFMVGGSQESVDRLSPFLSLLGENVLHVGKAGQGAILKLAVNAFFASQLASMAELLGFLARNGFSLDAAADYMGKFPIVSAPLAGAAKMMAAGNTTPMFTIDLIEKDLGYVLDTAAKSKALLPNAQQARAQFQQAQAKGLGAVNISGLASVFVDL